MMIQRVARLHQSPDTAGTAHVFGPMNDGPAAAGLLREECVIIAPQIGFHRWTKNGIVSSWTRRSVIRRVSASITPSSITLPDGSRTYRKWVIAEGMLSLPGVRESQAFSAGDHPWINFSWPCGGSLWRAKSWVMSSGSRSVYFQVAFS